VAAVTGLEEVDAGSADAALATVQAQGVQAEGVDAEADGALGEAGAEVADEALAPFHAVGVAVLVVTVHVGIAQQHVQAAVLHETLGLRLLIGEGGGGGSDAEGDQAQVLLHCGYCSVFERRRF